MVPGEKFSITASAQPSSGLITSRDSGFFRSMARLRLEVFRCANHGLSSKSSARDTDTCTSRRDRQGRERVSTLITSAPRSPRILVVMEPTSAHEKSRMRTPARGPPREAATPPGVAPAAVVEAPTAGVAARSARGTCPASTSRAKRDGSRAPSRVAQNSRATRCGSSSTSAGDSITQALMPRRRPSPRMSARVRVRKKAAMAFSHVARVSGSSVERL